MERYQTKETPATGIYYPRYNQRCSGLSQFSKGIGANKFDIQVRKNNELINPSIGLSSLSSKHSNSDLRLGDEGEKMIKVDN